MTEGQWAWMAAHISVDNDEELEKVCSPCQEKLKVRKCSVCTNPIEKEYDSNPEFDDAMFEQLKNNSN